MSSNPSYGIGGYGSGGYGNPPIDTLPIGYYLGLITSEYQGSSKFMAFLQSFLRKLDDVSQCRLLMEVLLDLDNATGVLLDSIGTIVGASRTLPFQPSGGISPVLDDTTYRVYIKARIAWNQWNGTILGMQAIWQSLFPSGTIVIADQQNMTADIIITGAFTSILQQMITNGLIVPRPEGVLYNYVFGGLPVFGFDADNQFVAGLDTGKFA